MNVAFVSSVRKPGFAVPLGRQGRRILLSADDGVPGRVRFLSMPIELAEGQRQTWVTVTRTGSFTDPRYGRFDITPAMLARMVANFDARVLGQEVFIDVDHKPTNGAAARVVRLAVEGNKLRALVEWTAFGIDAVRNRGFTYLSAEFNEDWHDNERGDAHGCVLLGAGLTVRPVIKNLDPVQLSAAAEDDGDEVKLAIHPSLIKHLECTDMNKHLKALRTRLLAQGLTEEQIKPLIDAFEKQLATLGEDEAKCLAMVESFALAGEAVAAQLKQLSAQQGPVTLQPTIHIGAGTDQAAVAAAVTKALADRAAADATAASELAAKVKVLSDTLGAAKALTEEQRTTMLAELQPMVNRGMTDDAVKALAAFAVRQAESGSAAAQLALMGYRPPSGSVHISLSGSSEINTLQAQIDKRLGFEGLGDEQRYERTGGKLLAKNKDFAAKCLAEFDAQHGARLVAEHKALAAGVGNVADSSVPVVFERTVLRETLYNLVGLQFVDVGTAAFANTIAIPYSYRDTTAAGISSARVYEGQAIPRAGVIQTSEEARPIPQKLSFRITNEMRYLLAASPIDFDPLAENVRNVTRIVGEDTDRVIQNEIIRGADEAPGFTATQSDTLTAQVNGTNRIFVLTQFPVCRPRRVFNLQGQQVGSTLNPVTVTLNSVARTEYTPGVTLSAGLYWIMDYNLGEIRFVNENGALQTPTSGWVLSIQYTYTLNVAKANLDVGSNPDTINDVYDRVLTLIGGRKVAIENDRYYTASMMLMSGAVDNALGQAKTFQANSSRPGTGLDADGSIGIIKGVRAWNTRAPGLDTADTRLVVGERGNTRFRMMRPLSMTDLTEARDASGNFIGMKEAYGEQWVVSHTPLQRRNATTSLVLYSVAGRVARA